MAKRGVIVCVPLISTVAELLTYHHAVSLSFIVVLNVALDHHLLPHYRNKVRAPPPDLDIRNVAGLLASHFASPNPPAYSSTPFGQSSADSSLSYSPYLPAHAREYDDESRGYASSRAGRGHYGSHHGVRPPSPSFAVGGIPSNQIVATPRPLAIPSLLPGSGSPSERVYLASEADSMRHSNIPPNIQSGPPTSPPENASSSVAPPSPTSQASGSNSARREPSMVVIACRQW